MRVDVSYKYLQRSEFTENVLDKNLQRIERRVKIFRRDDPIHISVHIEKNPHKEQYFCRAHIYLPSSKVLNVDEKSNNFSLAVNKAFLGLCRQLDKLKHKLQRHFRRRNVG